MTIINDYRLQEIEERDREIKRQEEAKKQLILKLCNVKKSSKITEEKLEQLKNEHDKALKLIQGLLERQQKYENQHMKKDRKITELEAELDKMYKGSDCPKVKRSSHSSSARRDLSSEMANHPERDQTDQVSLRHLAPPSRQKK